MSKQNLIARAAAAFAQRDLQSAERDCRAALAQAPDDPHARHLLGLVLRQRGDPAAAEPWLCSSVELMPGRAEYRINLSNLYSAQGRLRDAEAQLRAALTIEPDSRTARLALSRVLNRGGVQPQAEAEARALLAANDRDAEAWAALANAQRDQDRLEEAEASFRRALDIDPRYAVAHHNLGAVLGRLKRAAESLAILDRSAELGVGGAELQCNRGRALMQLGQLDEAETALAEAVQQAPELVDAQVLLAKLRFMRGRGDYASALRAAAQHSPWPRLGLALGDLLRRAGQLDEAMETLEALAARHPQVPEIEASLAVLLQERGDLVAALDRAHAAARARPDDATIAENLIAVLLQLGEHAEAARLILRERGRAPADQRWLAYEAVAAKLAGSARYGELYDYARFVQTFELEPPRGHASIAAFNAQLSGRLQTLHALQTHPLDQSLRHGTQSTRDLLAEDDPLIRSWLAALRAPLEEYRRRLGRADEHPFVCRNRDGATRLTGCWSVKLGPGGYHVNHIHPEGWISSAYYVDVPEEAADPATKAGWLALGAPRMPTPGAAAEHFVAPVTGRLALFPSYMWHGTIPIQGAQPRLTLAFDAVPTRGRGA